MARTTSHPSRAARSVPAWRSRSSRARLVGTRRGRSAAATRRRASRSATSVGAPRAARRDHGRAPTRSRRSTASASRRAPSPSCCASTRRAARWRRRRRSTTPSGGCARTKPVIASLGNVAASGGYYVASAADMIVADPGTITGSIGAIMSRPPTSPACRREGRASRSEVVKSGRFKDTGNPLRPLEPRGARALPGDGRRRARAVRGRGRQRAVTWRRPTCARSPTAASTPGPRRSASGSSTGSAVSADASSWRGSEAGQEGEPRVDRVRGRAGARGGSISSASALVLPSRAGADRRPLLSLPGARRGVSTA